MRNSNADSSPCCQTLLEMQNAKECAFGSSEELYCTPERFRSCGTDFKHTQNGVQWQSKWYRITQLGFANWVAIGTIDLVHETIPVHLAPGPILSGSRDYIDYMKPYNSINYCNPVQIDSHQYSVPQVSNSTCSFTMLQGCFHLRNCTFMYRGILN